MGIDSCQHRLLAPLFDKLVGRVGIFVVFVVLSASSVSWPAQAQQAQLYRVSDIAAKHSECTQLNAGNHRSPY
jgi:hypothetical protein